MITVIAKKNLICDQGIECFTKGKEYQSYYDYVQKLTEHTILINNQALQHIAGITWLKHFKLKK